MTHSAILRERISLIQINTETKAAIEDFLPDLEAALPGILDRFYAHIIQFANLKAMFRDQSRMDYAKSAQGAHWMRLFSVKFDDDYAQSVRRIGLIHSKIGLEPSWYIGAYAFVMSALYDVVAHKYQSRLSPEKAARKTAALLRALNQCVMLDMDMAISIYLEENKRTYDERISAIAVDFDSAVGSVVEGIASASVELEASSNSVAAMVSNTSLNTRSAAAASGQAATNVSAVSAASEEMSASLANVSNLAQEGSDTAERSVKAIEEAMGTMGILKDEIDKVNEIVSLITDIAEQTNLLALNATIEAARAGEAGKGFAVVAAEVKNLANQTGGATDGIRQRIDSILLKSDDTVQSLHSVQDTINRVSAISNDTFEAVQQQSAAVAEIARNAAEASSGTDEIVRSVQIIDTNAGETGSMANQVLEAVRELAVQSETLNKSVKTFLADIRG